MSENERRGLAERQIQLNRATASAASLFEPHRRRIMDLSLVAEGGPAAVLGAGNCNDVDLPALTARFGEVHLVDLDPEALRGAARRQAEDVQAKLVLHEGVDLSGILDRLAAWGRRAPTPEEVDAAVKVAGIGVTLPAGELGLCLSTCALTQMILTVAERLGERHPRCVDLVRAVRTGHLCALARSLRPNGLGVLVSDMVSSDTVPDLRSLPARALRSRMEALVREGNFFTGANPYLLAASLKTQPELAPLVRDVALHEPWLWQIAPHRWYLVFAVSFRRASA